MDMQNNAVLELRLGDRTGAFQFSENLQITRDSQHDPILSGSGQFAQRTIDYLSGSDPGLDVGNPRRVGYHIDGGGGESTHRVEFRTGLEDVLWGDGSGGDGPDNVTLFDASGEGVRKEDRADVFKRWLNRAVTDSTQPAYWYYNQFTDGTYADGGEAGLEARPMPVAVLNHSVSFESRNDANVTALDGSVELVRIAEEPSIVADARRKILDDIVDFG